MIKRKTHFEQVPLKVVKKIVEEQAEQEDVAVLPTTARNKKLNANPIGTGMVNADD